ncbi:MAG: cytochrome C oxidase subunit IV family protein [Methylotenera sp.]|nr:cytochrome C oxidase subunit IV family protein [Methylotenera sp.]
MMQNAQEKSTLFLTFIWALLIALTITTYRIDTLDFSGKNTMLTLLAISMLKSQMVANYLMGLHKTRLLWRSIMLGYFLIVGGLIALAYLIGLK